MQNQSKELLMSNVPHSYMYMYVHATSCDVKVHVDIQLFGRMKKSYL